MPTRMLRDVTDSEPVNSLSVHAERFFYRVIQKADDFGRLTANPKMLRPLLYPLLLEEVREADLQRWTAECEKAGLIRLYEGDGKALLVIPKFNQRTRALKSKYAAPPWEMDGGMPVVRPSSDRRPLTEAEAQFGDGDGGAEPPPLGDDLHDHELRRLVKSAGLELTIGFNTPGWTMLRGGLRSYGISLLSESLHKSAAKGKAGKNAVSYALAICRGEKEAAENRPAPRSSVAVRRDE